MLKILAVYGLPKQIVDAIGKMYENTKARVVSPDGKTDLPDILAGVLQGNTLTPRCLQVLSGFDYTHK